MFNAKFKKKLTKFFEPFMKIDANKRKMQELSNGFESEDDFQRNVPVDRMDKIIEVLKDTIEVKKGIEYKTIKEEEAIHTLEELKRFRTLPKELKSPQGYRIIPLLHLDIFKLGGWGICDACNKDQIVFMYIGVLNSAYCQACYEEWITIAKYYPQDIHVETRNIERTLKVITDENN